MRVGLPSVHPEIRDPRVERPERVDSAPGERVAAKRTPIDVSEIRSAIQRGYEAATGSAPSAETVDVLTAQVATETGYGEKMVGFNFGGIKGRSPEGTSAVCRTHEIIDGKDVVIRDAFRSYSSADSGATDYVRFLERRFPEALEAAKVGDVEGFAHALKSRGYFTADEGAYARAMRGAMGGDMGGDMGGEIAGAKGGERHGPARVYVRAGAPLHVDEGAPGGFATAGDVARVVDAIASSALRLAAHGASDDESNDA
jgi:flagellar protein FlgJ